MFPKQGSFDVVILGGGPTGIAGAETAASYGAKVALVESGTELGGAGVNTGTVPSKTLRETALALSGLRSRKLYGVDLSLRRQASVSDFLRHERNVKSGLNAFLAERIGSLTAVYHGTGSFVDAHTVLVRSTSGEKELRLHADHVLIATGSAPVRPLIFPFGMDGVFDSDSILDLDRLPKTLAVVGAGVIGSEYACTFGALGTKVHLIDGRDILLPFLDSEVSSALETAMQGNGIEFHWNERVEAARADRSGKIVLTMSSGKSLLCDAVLVAAGRTSNTGGLNLGAAGVPSNDRGLILVDEHFRTQTPHIYAAGDVIGFPALASTGMQQARIAMTHPFGTGDAFGAFRLLPTGIYTIPEIGMVGETEESLKRSGAEYIVGRAPYRRNARGRIIGDLDGFLKLLFRREDMMLMGVHAIGEQATELVHTGMVAMLAGSTVRMFLDACFNLPTLGELYKLAALDAALQVRTGHSVVGTTA